jgi:protein-S-isoprenylcysteine O-methyltransferase Ste14
MDTAHKSRWEISEVVFGFPLLAAIGLHLTFPLGLPQGPFRLALIPVGAALLVAGLSVALSARREFARLSQSMEPGQPITRMVETGAFSISRNPLYLGIVCLLSGLALLFNVLWILIMLLPSIVLCHFILIAPEERYLASKFGSEYAAYAGSVHRWFGRK